MNIRKQREQNKREAIYKRLQRIETVKSIITHCQKFIDAETALLNGVSGDELIDLHNKKVSEKHELLYLFTRFKSII